MARALTTAFDGLQPSQVRAYLAPNLSAFADGDDTSRHQDVLDESGAFSVDRQRPDAGASSVSNPKGSLVCQNTGLSGMRQSSRL